ncbi:MAG: PD-(D/E)XK nuclease family protein [Vicinamibacterales bacterium]
MPMNTGENAAFFPRLLGSRHDREVKVSAAFAACFQHSPVFRECVVGLLGRVCKLRKVRSEQWSCDTEVRVPNVGRIDIQLTGSRSDGSDAVSFWIENKVEAALTEEQLRRYRRKATGRYLVALTKHPPETGSRWLLKKGILAVRWQEVHRALRRVNAKGADRFLIHGFTDYLETLDMAHREDITLADLKRLDRLLAQIDSPKSSQMKIGRAFDIGSACLGVADDVLQIVLDTHGKRLANWRRWGPSYLKWFENGESTGHHIGFRFHDAKFRNWFGAVFYFPGDPNADPKWFVNGHVRGRDVDREYPFRRLTSSTGAIDAHRLADRFVRTVKPLKVI